MFFASLFPQTLICFAKSRLRLALAGLGVLALLSLAAPAHAVPAVPWPTAHVQPDGFTIMVHIRGDEFLGWNEDAEGNLIIFDEEKNGFCYAHWTDDGPVSTGELAGPFEAWRQRTKGMDIPKSRLDAAYQMRDAQRAHRDQMRDRMIEMMEQSGISLAPGSAPRVADISTLKRKAVIIYAEWSNRTSPSIPTPPLTGQDIYDLVFNPNTNSVNKYYKELLNTDEDIITPAAVTNGFGGYQGIIRVVLTLSAGHTNPGNDTTGRQAIMQNAISLSSSNGNINYKDFKTDGTTTLRENELSVGVIVDGYESAAGLTPGFWASAWSNYPPAASATNGVRIASAYGQAAYQSKTGTKANDILTVGVICHELAHSGYSFDDTYDYTQTSQGHGMWSIMAGGSWANKAGQRGGASPNFADAYNLVQYNMVVPGILGPDDTPAKYTVNNHLDIYRVNSIAKATNYFLLQQRKWGAVDNFDRGGFYRISSSSNASTGGVLIYHIDTTVPDNGRIMDKSTHYRCGIVEAHGGAQHLPNNQAAGLTDLWGGESNLYNDHTDPNSRLYSAYGTGTPTKTELSGVEISEITWNSSTGSTSFIAGDGDEPGGPILVSSFAKLESEIAKYGSATADVELFITASFDLIRALTVPANSSGARLFIKSTLGAPPVLKRAVNNVHLFTVSSNARLFFENVVIDGNKAVAPYNTNGSPAFDVRGSFTLSSGKIANNYSSASCGGVMLSGGTFTLAGGEVSGNAGLYGGGVNIGSGAFAMQGGQISGNSAEYGGGIYVSGGTLAITGGQISGNSAAYGGGIFANSGFTLGGSASVTGNTLSGAPNNVYLYANVFITLSTSAPPAAGMSVGVQTRTSSNVFVNSGAGASHAQYFHADVPGYAVVYSSGQLLLHFIPTYQLTAAAGAGGSISGTASGDYAQGHSVSITATPGAGRSFTNWTVSGATIVGGNAANPATFSMPANAVTIAANFESLPATVTSLIIRPAGTSSAPVNLQRGNSQQFGATVYGTNEPPQTVTWSMVDGGWGNTGIGAGGLMTIDPAHPGGSRLTIRATSTFDPSKYGESIVNVSATHVPSWDISLNTSGHAFPDAQVGYPAQAKLTVRVTNTGNEPTGNLSISLSGAGVTAFDLSAYTIPSIAVGNTATFTVGPKAGLPINSYGDTVTVSGGRGISASFPISFRVGAALYRVTVSSAGTGSSGGGDYSSGSWVSVHAGDPPEGMRFANWTSSPSVAFDNAKSPAASFAMPASAVTATAHFEAMTNGSITITNSPTALFTGETWTFLATLTGVEGGVVWSVSGGGSIDPASGRYEAPSSEQSVIITATSTQDSAIHHSVSIRVRPAALASFDGNGPQTPSLLGLANAFGSTAPADLAKYDLNGDEQIDDADIAMLFRLMGW